MRTTSYELTDTQQAPTEIDRETLVVSGVALIGGFMALIDSTVIIVALEPLARHFGVGIATIQWLVTAYTLALAATYTLTGWACDRFGTKRVYVTGLAVFLAGSAACALAWSAESLIVFRVLQGIGGGLILPAGKTVVARKAGPRRRGRVMGILGVPLVLAPIAGPILGGWLIESASWQWIFLINIPIGLAAVGLAAVALDREETRAAHPLDWLGFVLLAPGLGFLLFGLAQSAESDLRSALAGIPILLGVLLIAAFLIHAWNAKAPLLDVRQFADVKAGGAAATLMIATVALFGSLMLMALYYQSVRGATAFEAGLLLAPWSLGAMVMLPVAGWLSDRFSPYRLPLIGLLAIALGLAPFAWGSPGSSMTLLCTSSFVLGMGEVLVAIPASVAAMKAVPPAGISRLSSALSIATESSASIGIAIVSVLLASSAAGRLLTGGHGAPQGGSPDQRLQLVAVLSSSFAWMIALIFVAGAPALALAVGNSSGASKLDEAQGD